MNAEWIQYIRSTISKYYHKEKSISIEKFKNIETYPDILNDKYLDYIQGLNVLTVSLFL